MTETVQESGAVYREDVGLWEFPRREFAAERFDYKDGEHVVFGGPTQRGKTTLALQLLEFVATPSCPAYVAVSKPLDPTTERETKRLGYRRVHEWPAPRTVGEIISGEKPSGYVIWPKFGNVHTDVANAARVTGDLIDDRYTAGSKNKHGIMVMDDTMLKAKILGLDGQMVTLLAMSGAMGLGLWVFVQKPTDSGRTPIWAYGAAEHLFLTRDPDEQSQKRYRDIGGVDPKLVTRVLDNVGPYTFLYLKRSGGHMCLVGKS